MKATGEIACVMVKGPQYFGLSLRVGPSVAVDMARVVPVFLWRLPQKVLAKRGSRSDTMLVEVVTKMAS